jgi:hypothetical protein
VLSCGFEPDSLDECIKVIDDPVVEAVEKRPLLVKDSGIGVPSPAGTAFHVNDILGEVMIPGGNEYLVAIDLVRRAEGLCTHSWEPPVVVSIGAPERSALASSVSPYKKMLRFLARRTV